MKLYLKFLACLTLLTLSVVELPAQVLENYNAQLEITHRFEPFYSPEKATVQVNVRDFPMAEFRFGIPEGATVFIDQVLWMHAERDTTAIVDSEWLRTQFAGNDATRRVDILKRDLHPRSISIHKGYFAHGERVQVAAVEEAEVLVKRERNNMRDFFYVALISILLLTALYKWVFPVVFASLLKPKSVFYAEDFADGSARNRALSSDIVFYLVIFNLLLMLFIVTAVYYLDISFLRDILRQELNFMFLVWLSGSLVLLVLSILKLFWLKISTVIYGIGRIEFIHFFYMLRVFSYVLLLLVAVLLLGMSNEFMDVGQLMRFLLGMFFILYIGGISMLYFFMTKKVGFKNYHLFSYLCTAELIPFLVVAKLIVG